MSTTTTETKDVVHEYLSAWEEGNPDALTDVLADDFSITYEDASGTETELDVAGMQELMAGFLEALTDSDHEIHDLVAEGDTAIVRLTYSGVHEGELFGIEATGNHIAVDEYLTFHVSDGAIVDMHSLSDELSLLRQLDVDLPV